VTVTVTVMSVIVHVVLMMAMLPTTLIRLATSEHSVVQHRRRPPVILMPPSLGAAWSRALSPAHCPLLASASSSTLLAIAVVTTLLVISHCPLECVVSTSRRQTSSPRQLRSPLSQRLVSLHSHDAVCDRHSVLLVLASLAVLASLLVLLRLSSVALSSAFSAIR
jgi:hypothetical protein